MDFDGQIPATVNQFMSCECCFKMVRKRLAPRGSRTLAYRPQSIYAPYTMRRFFLALLVLSVFVAHSVWPRHVQTDWPTITLLGIFILIVASREVSGLLPFIKRLKLGVAEIEMYEHAQRLYQEVEKAEETGPIPAPETAAPEHSILELASKDREAAVVRLAIEIEEELYALVGPSEMPTERPKTIRKMVNELVSRQILPSPAAAAILEFRDVRNRVIHPSQAGVVPSTVLASAIDSGIRLLRLLRGLRG